MEEKHISSETMSRTQHTVKNVFFAACSFIIKILLNFISRYIFIRYLSITYLGLNSLFTNILSVLSLAELGIGSAIVYSLYKPVADNDIEQVKTLINLYKKIYWTIGTVILVVGLAIIPLLSYFMAEKPNVDVNLNVVYIIFLLNTCISYYFAHRRAIVFAYQRNDIESKISSIQIILLNVVQILILIFSKNYLIYAIAMPIFTLADSLIVFAISYRMFPQIRGKSQKLSKELRKEIVKNTSAMVCHQVGGVIVYSTDSLIISAVLGLTILGTYSNYLLITSTLITLFNLVITALKSSIGNQIASADSEKVFKNFKNLTFMLFWGAGFSVVCLLTLFQDFIRLWIGEQYLLPFLTIILIILNFYFRATRELVNAYKNCTGLFWNDRFKPLLEAGTNLVLDFAFVYFFGLNGILIATIMSTVFVCLWLEPFILYKNYFKKSVKSYYLMYLMYFLVTMVACCATYGICYFIPSSNAWWFVLKCCVSLITPNLIFYLASFKTNEFKYVFQKIKSLKKR